MRAHRPRRSIRLRLTLVYAVMLVLTCAGLLAFNYALLYNSLYTNVNGPTAAELAGIQPPTDGSEGAEKFWAVRRELAENERLRRRELLHTGEMSALALALTFVAGVGVSWIVTGRMLRPLRTLTTTTRRISQDHLHERVALAGPDDELKELADTFDAMVTRLEGSFNSQRRFVADASHELRTPLAIVRTGAEVLLAKQQSTPEQWQAMATRVLTATGRAERLLDGLLALARSDSGAVTREPHDLALAAATALGDADPEAVAADLTVTTDLRPAPALGDPALLDQLVRNLVENAVRHNVPGGWVDVTTGAPGGPGGPGAPGGPAVVVVRNSGPAIPPAEVDRLFEPFQRLSADRPAGGRSTGLGLAIVRSIVRAHGGTVVAEPQDAGGLTVTVTLPPPPPPTDTPP
ncbi:HAMP domain-containing sensor histidine kinase [Dactylosporangium sp. NPDC050588]|uniref:sensor histidine kinase n=1 Tax=Dactylosporangium sp. NPDC050588 TaxID=3157211 RepID=UPI00340DEC0F